MRWNKPRSTGGPRSAHRPSALPRLRHSLRWHSSSEARAESLHLILCRSPGECWRSLPSLPGDGSREAEALIRRATVPDYVRRPSLDERRS